MPGGGSDGMAMDSRRVGVNLATVCDIEDPDGLGRVKCLFITGDEETEETEWAYVVTPFGGNEYGNFFHPHVDDVVLLAFEDGDIHMPYVIGSLWWKNKDIISEAPVKLEDGNEDNHIYQILTPEGNYVKISDEDGNELIEIQTKAGTKFLLDDGEQKIELTDEPGETSMIFDLEQSEINIKCKKIVIDASGNTFTMDESGAELDCKPNVKIMTATLEEEASGNATVKSAVLNLESSGVANLKGSVVKIN